MTCKVCVCELSRHCGAAAVADRRLNFFFKVSRQSEAFATVNMAADRVRLALLYLLAGSTAVACGAYAYERSTGRMRTSVWGGLGACRGGNGGSNGGGTARNGARGL